MQTKNKPQEITTIDVGANIVTEHEVTKRKNQAAHRSGGVPQEAWHNTTPEKSGPKAAGWKIDVQPPQSLQRNSYASACLWWDYCISTRHLRVSPSSRTHQHRADIHATPLKAAQFSVKGSKGENTFRTNSTEDPRPVFFPSNLRVCDFQRGQTNATTRR